MSKTQIAKTLTIRVPLEVREYFDQLSEYEKQSLNEVINRTIERGMKIDQIIDYLHDAGRNGEDITEITVQDITEYVNPKPEKPKIFLPKGQVEQKKPKSFFQRIFGRA